MPYRRHENEREAEMKCQGIEIALTETLTSQAEKVNNFCMLGRILTQQKCPICDGPFKVKDNIGIFCPKEGCKNRAPTKFIIDSRQFKAGRLYSDPHGNVFDSYRVAYRQLEAMRRDWDNNTFTADDWIPKKTRQYRIENLTVEYLRGYAVEVKADTKAHSTARNIKQRIKDYILPEFGKMDIRDVRSHHIKKFYHDLLETESKTTKEKLAPKTVRHILNVFGSFLRAYKDIIKIIPDLPRFTVVPKKEKKWLGIEKQMIILTYIPEDHQLAFETLFDTGMRIGELRAIKVGDLRDGYITVSRAFSDNKLRQRTKTGIEATFKVSFSLWRKLVEHAQGKSRDKLLFTEKGKFYHKDRLSTIWILALNKAGIEHIDLQQASRHSRVSRIRQKKEREALQEAAEQLGHTNLSTGKKHYILSDEKEIK